MSDFEGLTWDELCRASAMRDVRLSRGVRQPVEREVSRVYLISDTDQIRRCLPNSIVVLHEHLADVGWSVEIAVRHAWERNVLGVIARLPGREASAVEMLADRLGVVLGYYDGELAELALRLTATTSQPETLRSAIIADCAIALTSCASAGDVITALNARVPSTLVYLGTPTPETASDATTRPTMVLRLPLDPPDSGSQRVLVAQLSTKSAGWAGMVRHILGIARQAILAIEFPGRLTAAARSRQDAHALRLLTSVPPDPQPAAALGLQTGGPVIAAFILARGNAGPVRPDDILNAALRDVWPTRSPFGAPIPYEDGWVTWARWDDAESPAQAARALSDRLGRELVRLRLGLTFHAGLSQAQPDFDEFRRTIRQAWLSARTAAHEGRPVASYEQTGATAFLSLTGHEDVHETASAFLGQLMGEPGALELIRTVRVYLDCAGAVARAAEILGVHRNTVTGRIERARKLGVPLDDPERRLAVHLASYVATTERSDPP